MFSPVTMSHRNKKIQYMEYTIKLAGNILSYYYLLGTLKDIEGPSGMSSSPDYRGSSPSK